MELLTEYFVHPEPYLLVLLLILSKFSAVLVPHNHSVLIERFGCFNRQLDSGIHFIFPFLEKVAARCNFKEQALDIPYQEVMTKEKIALQVDAVLYLQISDAYLANYGVENYQLVLQRLTQTALRMEVGKVPLNTVLQNRESLNQRVCVLVNAACASWGIKIIRCELMDVIPPAPLVDAFMRAERDKRTHILAAEAERFAQLNKAEAEKAVKLMAASTQKTEKILRAEADARAVLMVAQAKAQAIKMVKKATGESNSIGNSERQSRSSSSNGRQSSVIPIPEPDRNNSGDMQRPNSIASS